MFDPTEHDLDQDMESSMALFRRALAVDVGPLKAHTPNRLLLVLDGSAQDETAVGLAGQLKRRFDCSVDVLDARESVAENSLAEQTAQSLDATALEKADGDSFDQILAAVDRTGADLVVAPCPYGRDLNDVGTDSTGTVIDVLLSRCPAPLLVVRGPLERPEAPLENVVLLLIGENEAARAAAEWAVGFVAPDGLVELLLVLESETVENVRSLMREIQPDVEISSDDLSDALERSQVRVHTALHKSAESAGFRYQLQVRKEADGPVAELSDAARPPLLVVALERADHGSQGHVHDRIRQSRHPVLVVPK